MLIDDFTVSLNQCVTGAFVEARVVKLSRERANAEIDRKWWTAVPTALRRNEEDADWDWRELVSTLRYNKDFLTVGVECEGSIEAAMILHFNRRSILVPGAPVAFIERLATAPWNRETLTNTPKFRGAGTGLLDYSIYVSYLLGGGGRVQLQAGDSNFYLNRGFVDTNDILVSDGVFELPESLALKRLVEIGLL